MSEFNRISTGKKKYAVQIMSFDEKVPLSSVEGGVREDLSYRDCGAKRQRTSRVRECVVNDNRAGERNLEETISWVRRPHDEEITGNGNTAISETITNQQDQGTTQVSCDVVLNNMMIC